jgi:YggT family protein
VLAILSLLLLLVEFLLVARAVLDWTAAFAGPAAFGSVRSRLSTGVMAVTEPILAPIRRVLPPLRVGRTSIDLAFIVLFLAIVLIRSFI